MAEQKLNVKKLIGAFNQYLDSESTLSFSEYMNTAKVSIWGENTHINIMEFRSKKGKYEEFINYLIDNYDNYKGEKHKIIAIRQILAECLDQDEDEKITVNTSKERLQEILSSKPVSTGKWQKLNYVARKTGKTLLSITLLSSLAGAVIGLFFGWGVGFIPGMTGNIWSNLLNGLTFGVVIGAPAGLAWYSLSYLVNALKIKRLGKKDKKNLRELKSIDLTTTKDFENSKIPLMTLVNDFFSERQKCKLYRTSKNPFKHSFHRNKRDLNRMRFKEISESFGELIDALEQSGDINRAKVVKKYYYEKFKSLFTHPDFAGTASKYAIDKKLTDERLIARRISNKSVTKSIKEHDPELIDQAFNFKPKSASTAKPVDTTTKPTTKTTEKTKPVVTTTTKSTTKTTDTTKSDETKTTPIIKSTTTKSTTKTTSTKLTTKTSDSIKSTETKPGASITKPSNTKTTVTKPTSTKSTTKPTTTTTTTTKPDSTITKSTTKPTNVKTKNKVEVVIKDKKNQTDHEQLVIPGMEDYMKATSNPVEKKKPSTKQNKDNDDTFLVEVKVVDSFTNNN